MQEEHAKVGMAIGLEKERGEKFSLEFGSSQICCRLAMEIKMLF